MAMEMRTETVTPELAQKYLKQNVDNYRKISRAKVALYAQEMKAGRWQTNGEAIVFDESGTLKNGQHRLAAILVAGVPVEMTIITGVKDDVTIYDSGLTRSVRQIAQAQGRDISTTEVAVATAIVSDFGKAPRGKVLDYISLHGDEIARAFRISGASSSRNISGRASCVLAAFMMLRDGMKSYEVETFFKVFNSGNVIGVDGYEPSNALVARRIFLERYKGMGSNQKGMKEQTEVMLLAMMDFRKGKSRQLNYQVKDPMNCDVMMRRIIKEDGLEEAKAG